ncbi:MAG: GNAT family N-acetyltransferase [Propionibacteriales bacterium]|nr:GNAT family N-acetyltransferase [Propionibacteriales bacterium]
MTLPTPIVPDGFAAADLSVDDARAQLIELDLWGFPGAFDADEVLTWAWPLDLGRARALHADGDPALAAMHGSYPLSSFPVPGATTAAAGLTWVCVHPQHRRQGLLRAMIQTHFADCRARGEAVSVLTATEPVIYGRFGYGLASRTASLTLSRGAKLRPVPGSEQVTTSIEAFDPSRHTDLVHRLHSQVATASPNRPGWVLRETAQMRAFYHDDPASRRDGFESQRILLAYRDADVVGYVLFRRKLQWGERGADGVVVVNEYAAADAAATHALWSAILDLDLTTTIRQRLVPLDDPLLVMLVDLRAATPKVADNLWVRLIDVPAALASRRYAAAIDLRIRVTDEELPANQAIWRLKAAPFADGVEVTPASEADVELDVRELGSLYLGGTSAVALAQAGLVRGSGEQVQRLAAAFSWPVQPASSWVF